MGTCADRDALWLTMQDLQLQVNSDHQPSPQPSSSTFPYLDDPIREMALSCHSNTWEAQAGGSQIQG